MGSEGRTMGENDRDGDRLRVTEADGSIGEPGKSGNIGYLHSGYL